MESANLPDFARILCRSFRQRFLDKMRDLLYQLIQVHRGSPLRLAGRQDVGQQISPICQRRTAELGLSHDQWWLERELVPQ